MTSNAPTAIRLHASNRNAEGILEALSIYVLFETYEASQAFVAALPKTAQRRVFAYNYTDPDGRFSVNTDVRTYNRSALVNFRRFVKAAIATGAPIEFRTYEAGSWYPAVTEADIREAFGIA